MTVSLSPREIGRFLAERWGEAVLAEESCVLVRPDLLLEVAGYLKNAPEWNFDYCDMLTAVDYERYFELVYRLVSLPYNRLIVLKVRIPREEPSVPSLTPLYGGADFQEREVFDLFGITFTGHPCLRRIMLWDGFTGHPLRKDYHGS